jgi:hypothetical protein
LYFPGGGGGGAAGGDETEDRNCDNGPADRAVDDLELFDADDDECQDVTLASSSESGSNIVEGIPKKWSYTTNNEYISVRRNRCLWCWVSRTTGVL